MYENVEIESLDYYGRGVAHINQLVTFILNALPKEIVDIKITKKTKKYQEAVVLNYKQKSKERIESICPYFQECGGCQLLFFNYENTLKYKKQKVKEQFIKNKIPYNKEIEIIKNPKDTFYRNKISLKIQQGKIGFYKENTHELVEINSCMVANEQINKVIENYKLLNIKEGFLTIRCNNNQEILLIIETKEKNYNIELQKLKEIIKLVGIVYNNKTIYGENFFYERIGGFLFKVSYNSFFQINPFITEELFQLVEKNIDKDSIVLDLYSGVGTLSVVASLKAKEVYSIEIIPNAVLNANKNALLNNRKNIKCMLGDASKIVDKLNIPFHTMIVDPPRSGLDKKTMMHLKNLKPQKIIYISCDLSTLIRDLNLLQEYEIKEYKLLDMFSYSYHVESFTLLSLKKDKKTW